MAGTLALDVVVAPNGEVDRTGVDARNGIEGETAACVASVVRRVEFDPPGGSGVTLPLNMTFVPKKKSDVRCPLSERWPRPPLG